MNTIPRKLGRYLIIREVGRGAMGVVYKAHDPVIERDVAIKAINLNFQVTADEKAVYLNRFYREAKAAGKLSHPGIVTIYDVDEDPETSAPFIVMEYLEGTTVQDIMSSGGKLPVERITDIIIQVADALNYAHGHGVIHRDVKSANILILNDLKAKITDFGIARLPSSDLTRSGQFIGTPNYMSPEQIEGKGQVDGRSDLFSLGVIFYMLLTGERPFTGDSFNTVAYKIVNVDPLPPRSLNGTVPEPYNPILQKLMAKNPDERYQTGLELITDLKKIEDPSFIPEVQSAPVHNLSENLALDPSEVQETEKEKIASGQRFTLFRRKPSRKTIVITALLMLLSGVGSGAYFYVQMKRLTPVKSDPVSSPAVITARPAIQANRQEIIRRKWDLAMNYFKNQLYDKCIEELHGVLLLNPSDQEARKYLDLAMNQKHLIDQKKQEEKPQPEKRRVAMPASTKPKPAQSQVQNRAAETKGPVIQADFELEHSFRSGILNIYLENKLIYQAEFQGTKKKVLLFTNYQGKLTGSFLLPAGTSNIRVEIASNENNITVGKQTTVVAHDGDHPHLSIRYLKTNRQLELKWT